MPQTKDVQRAARIAYLLDQHIERGTMEPSQVTAALGLLRKYVPDLSSVTHKGDAEAPLTIITRAE